MKERIKKQRSGDQTVEASESDVTPTADATRLKDDLDDLLDEIDDALETNAEEFVKNYVQKGGE